MDDLIINIEKISKPLIIGAVKGYVKGKKSKPFPIPSAKRKDSIKGRNFGKNDFIEIDWNAKDIHALNNFRVEAFHVAGIGSYELEEELKVLAEKYKDDFKGFEENARRKMLEYGIGLEDQAPTGWLKTNLDTAIISSYHAGEWQQLQSPVLKRVYPAYRYMTVADNRVRPEHAALHGKVYANDDPIWESIFPPNGWNCFEAGTKIKTENGWIAIELIKTGDSIYGGSGKLRPVTFCHSNYFKGNLIVISVGKSKLAVTPNHRFLSIRGWRRAEALKPHDIIVKIPEFVFNNVIIFYIKHFYSFFYKRIMSLPGIKPAAVHAHNPNVKLGNINIEPIRIYSKIINWLKTKLVKIIQHQLFGIGRIALKIWMKLWIIIVNIFFLIRHFFSNFRSFCGGGGFKFFSHFSNRFRICFVSSKPRMFHPLSILAQQFSGILAALNIIKPLNSYGFASFSRRDAKIFQKIDNGSVFHSTAKMPADLTNSKQSIKIEYAEGFGSGAPLDRFNSLYCFFRWAVTHLQFMIITKIEKKYYEGQVYNLTIKEDESYITELGIAHNCRCYVNTVDRTEAADENINRTSPAEREAIIKAGKIDRNFNRNSGMTMSIWGKWLQEKISGKNYNEITDRMKTEANKMPDAAEVVKKLEINAEKFRDLDFTVENFFKDFPKAMAKTPLGEFKFTPEFLNKLEARGREAFLGLIKPTLEKPEFVFVDKRNGTVFFKAFTNGKTKIYSAVLKDLGGGQFVTFYQRGDIIDKIKEGKLLIYSLFPESANSWRGQKLTARGSGLNFDTNIIDKKSNYNPADIGTSALLRDYANFRILNLAENELIIAQKPDEVWAELQQPPKDDMPHTSIICYIKYRLDGFGYVIVRNGSRADSGDEVPYSDLINFRNGMLIYNAPLL